MVRPFKKLIFFKQGIKKNNFSILSINLLAILFLVQNSFVFNFILLNIFLGNVKNDNLLMSFFVYSIKTCIVNNFHVGLPD